jgi:uncharacterized protein with PQ loop repeat
MTEVFGWLGSFLLSVCSIPQAIQCYKQGHANGISGWTTALWGAGMASALVYVATRLDWPLIMNYAFNLAFVWSPIAYYKFRPRA